MPNEKYTIVLEIDGKNNASQAIDKTNKSLKDMQTATDKTTSNWGKFKDGVSNALGAFAIAGGFAAIVGEINQLGAAANAAEITFNQVSGGAENAADSLARMRALTGGVIDDMALMKGASSLLVTGIAQTSEQAEGLVNLGARLGQVMGVDAAESIANLNSALLNNSFMRLDTLGISAAQVRERVNELKAAGLDMSAAFSQAVQEIGTEKLESLGAAADTAGTAMNRLATRAINLGQDLAQGLNTKLEEAAVAFEQLLILGDLALGGTGGIPMLEQQKRDAEEAAAALEALTAEAEHYLSVSDSAYFRQTGQHMDLTPFLDTADVAAQFQTLSAEIQAQVGSGNFFQTMFGEGATDEMKALGREMAAGLGEGFESAPDSFFQQYAADFDNRYKAVADASRTLQYQTEQTTIALQNQAVTIGVLSSAFDNVLTKINTEPQTALDLYNARMQAIASHAHAVDAVGDAIGNVNFQVDKGNRLLQEQNSVFLHGAFGEGRQNSAVLALNSIEDAYASFQNNVSSGSFSVSGMNFFDPNSVSDLKAEAQSLTDEYESLLARAEASDFELVTQDQVDRAHEIANSANNTANEAERMAQAFENASLAQLAGAGGGGRQNEFYQGVLSQVSDPEQRAALEHQFNLQSGVETANTMVIEYAQALNAAIIDEFGVGRGAQAGEQIAMALEQGMMQGLEGVELQRFVEQQVGFALSGEGGMGQQQITVQSGEGYIALAQRTGIDRQTLEAANGGGMLLAGQIITVGDGTTLVAVNGSPEDLAASTIGGAASNVLGMFGGGDGTGLSSADPISPEGGETISQAAMDMETIQTSMETISALDVSTTIDPMIGDLELAQGNVDAMQASMEAFAGTSFNLQVPISFVFDNVTADILSRNPQIVQTVKMILPQLGVNVP